MQKTKFSVQKIVVTVATVIMFLLTFYLATSDLAVAKTIRATLFSKITLIFSSVLLCINVATAKGTIFEVLDHLMSGFLYYINVCLMLLIGGFAVGIISDIVPNQYSEIITLILMGAVCVFILKTVYGFIQQDKNAY